MPTPGTRWAADTGCFGSGYPGDEAWLRWLDRLHGHYRCLFATAPDVVGDARATLARSAPWFDAIRARGYRAALVAQDGLVERAIPWASIDVLFIGGTTDWKLSPDAAQLAQHAKRRGLWLHMGRVNSGKRWRYAKELDCDSADGTFLAFAPDANLERLRRWERHDHG
ncbi:hypothetical protein JOD54_001112 [Actinokineospora baliensis]|uniref:hypothetical protein n=1 Tax=Actinokineospora baliensis TaxID=547056 RepID=UPI00195685A6|nr:hypothetical protein [Actinokineospora baliensis]MBM7770908.1 hypothetical protein [Actinokineospora baliensis]